MNRSPTRYHNPSRSRIEELTSEIRSLANTIYLEVTKSNPQLQSTSQPYPQSYPPNPATSSGRPSVAYGSTNNTFPQTTASVEAPITQQISKRSTTPVSKPYESYKSANPLNRSPNKSKWEEPTKKAGALPSGSPSKQENFMAGLNKLHSQIDQIIGKSPNQTKRPTLDSSTSKSYIQPFRTSITPTQRTRELSANNKSAAKVDYISPSVSKVLDSLKKSSIKPNTEISPPQREKKAVTFASSITPIRYDDQSLVGNSNLISASQIFSRGGDDEKSYRSTIGGLSQTTQKYDKNPIQGSILGDFDRQKTLASWNYGNSSANKGAHLTDTSRFSRSPKKTLYDKAKLDHILKGIKSSQEASASK